MEHAVHRETACKRAEKEHSTYARQEHPTEKRGHQRQNGIATSRGKEAARKNRERRENRTAHDKANGAERGVHQHGERKKRNYSSV